MDDKQQTDATEDSENGDTPEEASPIDRANKAAERLEDANEKTGENLARAEKLKADSILDGKADAGKVEKKEDESDADYAKRKGFIDESG